MLAFCLNKSLIIIHGYLAVQRIIESFAFLVMCLVKFVALSSELVGSFIVLGHCISRVWKLPTFTEGMDGASSGYRQSECYKLEFQT